MGQLQKVTDSQIKEAYAQTGNVWKAGELLGIVGQSVHERLVKLGVDLQNRPFQEHEWERLKREYLIFRDAGNLDALASAMGHTKQFLARKAREVGLTSKSHQRTYQSVWKYMSAEAAQVILEKFKKSSMNVGQFCKRWDYDDLGFSNTMKRYFPDDWEFAIESKAGKDSKYRIGRGFEYRTRDDLRSKGYFVLRSPRSGSPTDLVAIKADCKVLFVQCKRGGNLPVGEWNELFDLCESVGSVPILAEMPGVRGIRYWQIVDRKDGSKKRQPRIEVTIGALGVQREP